MATSLLEACFGSYGQPQEYKIKPKKTFIHNPTGRRCAEAVYINELGPNQITSKGEWKQPGNIKPIYPKNDNLIPKQQTQIKQNTALQHKRHTTLQTITKQKTNDSRSITNIPTTLIPIIQPTQQPNKQTTNHTTPQTQNQNHAQQTAATRQYTITNLKPPENCNNPTPKRKKKTIKDLIMPHNTKTLKELFETMGKS